MATCAVGIILAGAALGCAETRVFSAAFAPCLRKAVEFPDGTSEIARTVASSVFWHLSDELLDRGLARWTQTASHDGEEPEWRPVLHNYALVCLFFQLFLKHAFDGSLCVGRVDSAMCRSSYNRPGIHARS
jgi:hypothetical protein